MARSSLAFLTFASLALAGCPGPTPTDAGTDAPFDGGSDAGPTDVGVDAPDDAGVDAPLDTPPDAPTDAGPPVVIQGPYDIVPDTTGVLALAPTEGQEAVLLSPAFGAADWRLVARILTGDGEAMAPAAVDPSLGPSVSGGTNLLRAARLAGTGSPRILVAYDVPSAREGRYAVLDPSGGVVRAPTVFHSLTAMGGIGTLALAPASGGAAVIAFRNIDDSFFGNYVRLSSTGMLLAGRTRFSADGVNDLAALVFPGTGDVWLGWQEDEAPDYVGRSSPTTTATCAAPRASSVPRTRTTRWPSRSPGTA